MSLKLGSNSINKAYLGTTEIQKMYLGADLVFDNSAPPVEPDDLFPGAVGFGAQWVFDRDYDVVVVTNLNATGTGSFKAAVESTTTKPSKIVVFNGLSGTITTDSIIDTPTDHQIYIAGQTSENGILLRGLSTFRGPLLRVAGGDGIMVRGMGLAIGATGTNNVDGDNITLDGGQNIMIDHCCLLWSTDENLGGWYAPSDITVQNCVVAEALMYSTHDYSPEDPHSMGLLAGNNQARTTFYKNVMATNNQRNPLVNAGVGALYETVSNVIWNHGAIGGSVQNNNYNNFIGNFYNKDNGVDALRFDILINTATPSNGMYVRDNYTTKRTSSNDDQWLAVGGPTNYNSNAPTSYQSLTPFETPLKDEPAMYKTALLAELTDLESGSGMFAKNSAETRVLGYVAAQSGGALIDDPSDVGGYPTIAAGTIITDSNGNGIPDDLEGTWGNDTFGYINSLVSGAAPPVEVIDYYVSFSEGLDTNDGTELAPWKTLDKFADIDFPEGTIIGLKSGDTWYAPFTRTSKTTELTITSYGEGAKPKISGLATHTDTYTHQGGNIWVGTKSYTPTPTRLKLDGVEVLKGNFYAELGTDVPDTVTWFYGDNGDGGDRLYIYSAEDPTSLEVVFAEYRHLMEIEGCENLTFDGLAIEGSEVSGMRIKTGDNVTVKNCDIGAMSIVGVYVGTASTNCNMHDNNFDTEYALDYTDIGVYDGDGGTPTSSSTSTNDGINVTYGTDINIYDNTFTNWGHAAIRLASYGSDEVTGCKVYGNYSTLLLNMDYGGGISTESPNSHDNEIYNNHTYRVKSWQINGYSQHIHHNILHTIIKSDLNADRYGGQGISMHSSGACHSTLIENNVFIDVADAGIRLSGTNSPDNYGHIVRNNIIMNCGLEVSHKSIDIGDGDSSAYDLTFHNNTIYSDSETSTVNYYGTMVDVATFNTLTSNGNNIADNLADDPLLTPEYYLNPGSTAINGGTAALSTLDYYGTLMDVVTPDIGITENVNY